VPEINLVGGLNDDVSTVLSLMLYPNDEGKRVELLQVLAAKNRKRNSQEKEVTIPVCWLEMLLNFPSMEQVESGMKNDAKKGVFSGEVLLGLYFTERFELGEPSIRKVSVFLEGQSAEMIYSNGQPMKSSDSKIKGFFREFNSVAHLWAAFRLNVASNYAENLFDEQGFGLFLGVAKVLEKFGVETFPA